MFWGQYVNNTVYGGNYNFELEPSANSGKYVLKMGATDLIKEFHYYYIGSCGGVLEAS